ncbi:hypothetical protein V2J09_010631 [Rumex salicifolius]
MKAYMLFFAATILVSFLSGIEATTFTIRNNCPWTIWPAALTSANSPQLGNTGFALAQGASQTIGAPARWEGRFWARTFCGNNGGRFTCPIGDCGSGQVACNGNGGAPPVSLAEFRLNGDGNKDFYDISLVDGFNLPVTIAPRTGGCPSTSCPRDVNAACPSELAIRASNGGVIGCKSACLAFNTDAYCCRGSHNTPQTCPASNYSQFFKSQCPQAYSYAYDDGTSTFTCPSGGDYTITFCP